MLVFAAQATERLQYILDEILLHRLGLKYTITDNPDYFLASQTPKINYSQDLVEACLNIPASNLLYDERIVAQKLEVREHPSWKKTFFNHTYINIPDFKTTTSYLPFDMLSASFYLLSRYEEYLGAGTDEHKRFKAENSLAFQQEFLHFPLVDFWVQTLATNLQKCYPKLGLNQNTFRQLNTIDIDFAYKFKGLSNGSKWRKILGSILKGKPDFIPINPPEPDPYDTYEFLLNAADKKQIETQFFFLFADYGNHDKNISPNSIEMKNLVQTLAKKYSCGIHPSYKGALISKLYQKEHQYFKQYTGKDALHSRHHFLKIKMPESYQRMLKMGIQHDYSMAYSKHLGFRASTAQAFKCYDLLQEKTLDVWIHSPCVMDVTLKNGLNLNITEAIQKIKDLKETVKSVNGEFISIWHNSNFGSAENWENWEEVYLSLFE
ncbi:MAG: polysaccharide deacetylase family protein [Bacteroidota bacterium]|nr:polysaccharide deacetylase family protein [Bacteroidota bacterium]